jgi:hypothetical protein
MHENQHRLIAPRELLAQAPSLRGDRPFQRRYRAHQRENPKGAQGKNHQLEEEHVQIKDPARLARDVHPGSKQQEEGDKPKEAACQAQYQMDNDNWKAGKRGVDQSIESHHWKLLSSEFIKASVSQWQCRGLALNGAEW